METELLKAHPLFLGNMANSTVDDDDKHWVGGDGGPLIVLQTSVIPQWQGAMGSEDDLSDDREELVDVSAEDAHLYAPGEVAYETDSDAAFLCGEYLTQRYGRDMLVLEDSSWSGRFFLFGLGEIGIVQVQCLTNNLPKLIQETLRTEPDQTGPFQMQDEGLRLMVGADTSEDACGYGFSEVLLMPGSKQWKRYETEWGWLFVIE